MFSVHELFVACESKDFSRVREILQENPFRIPVNNMSNSGRWSVVHYAAFHGDFQITEYLVGTLFARINIENVFGETPFMKAAEFDHFDVCEYLYSQGADLAIKDRYGKSALDYAREKRRTRMVELITRLSSMPRRHFSLRRLERDS
jgi:ankyrin repeat protein